MQSKPKHTPLLGFSLRPYVPASCVPVTLCTMRRRHHDDDNKTNRRLTWRGEEMKWLIDIWADEPISQMSEDPEWKNEREELIRSVESPPRKDNNTFCPYLQSIFWPPLPGSTYKGYLFRLLGRLCSLQTDQCKVRTEWGRGDLYQGISAQVSGSASECDCPNKPNVFGLRWESTLSLYLSWIFFFLYFATFLDLGSHSACLNFMTHACTGYPVSNYFYLMPFNSSL